LGSNGRGVTEYFGVTPTEVDMIIGSMATTLSGGGGFCAGSNEVIDHQRITSMSYVYSAALPAILAVTASESISLLSTKEGEDQLSILQENGHTLRSILDKSDFVETTSDYNSPVTHYRLTKTTITNCGLATLQDQERALQEIVDDVLPE
jgi:serine palmitoyltransferase